MCGIVGVFNFKNNAEEDKPFLEWALKTMHHRGPDSNGTWSNNLCYSTGFVRLAIRDLTENGSQPMLSADDNYCISFNGEIYNSDPYRLRLQNEGVHFKSTTDTEVLLYALIHWGAEYVLQNFDGIFAFAFYDTLKNELVLARDRSGIKPLYIGKSIDGVVYSSQYDHLINHRYFRNNPINAGALGAYLSLGYVPENAGIIDGTYLLPHGHYVILTNEAFSTHKFYNYPLKSGTHTNSSLEEKIESSVKSQLVSDVSVGTFMSGGVDSPLVSYYANKAAPIQSFTIGMNDKRFDESDAAAAFAGIFHTQHHCKNITDKDLFATIADNTKAFSEPFADYSSIPTLLLSEYARKNVTVALSGDGGDELFWGYPRNSKMLKQGLLFQKSKPKRWMGFLKQKVLKTERTIIKKHLQENDFPAFYYRSLFVTGADHWIPKVFKGKVDPAFWYKQIYKEEGVLETDEKSIMDILRKLEFDIHLQRILIKVDRASMYHSLEVRVPLLSNDMIEYSTHLSHLDCIENGNGKINLKNLLISKSNKQLVLQPKKGFIIPLGNWIKGSLKSDIEKKLLNMPPDLAVFFDRKQVGNLLSQHFTGKEDWSWFIWTLYSLVNWNDHHRNKFNS